MRGRESTSIIRVSLLIAAMGIVTIHAPAQRRLTDSTIIQKIVLTDGSSRSGRVLAWDSTGVRLRGSDGLVRRISLSVLRVVGDSVLPVSPLIGEDAIDAGNGIAIANEITLNLLPSGRLLKEGQWSFTFLPPQLACGVGGQVQFGAAAIPKLFSSFLYSLSAKVRIPNSAHLDAAAGMSLLFAGREDRYREVAWHEFVYLLPYAAVTENRNGIAWTAAAGALTVFPNTGLSERFHARDPVEFVPFIGVGLEIGLSAHTVIVTDHMVGLANREYWTQAGSTPVHVHSLSLRYSSERVSFGLGVILASTNARDEVRLFGALVGTFGGATPMLQLSVKL